MKNFLMAMRLVLAGILLVTLTTACKDKEADVSFNPDFSINLLSIGDKWPNKKKMKEREKTALEKYGRPDFLRLLWNRQGSVMIRDQFNAADKSKMKKALSLETSWVYLDKGIELVFAGETFSERRINDEIRLIARMGDPEAVRKAANGMTEWTFYSTGRMVKLVNGTIVETREFPAMSGFLK